jgi:hypothetical protein
LLHVSVKVLWAEEDAESSSVFDGHTGALALVGHHRVSSITKKADSLLVQVWVRFVDPQPPGLNLLADTKVAEDLSVKLRVVIEELTHGAILSTPGLADSVTLLALKEAVVRKQLSTIARRQDNLVPFAFLASPVLQGFVL